MKYMKPIVIFAVFFLTNLFTSCGSLFNSNSNTTNEPVYNQRKVWTLQTDSFYDSWFYKQYGQYFYICETDKTGGDKKYFYSKIDLSNGTRVWKTQSFEGPNRKYPLSVNVNGKKYIAVHAYSYPVKNDSSLDIAKIMLFSDETGQLEATIQYRQYLESFEVLDNEPGHIGWGWLFVNGSIYWPTRPSYKRGTDLKTATDLIRPGLAKLDLSSVDFTKPADELQYIQPTMAWTNTENYEVISVYPVEKDGIIYFITYFRIVDPWTEYDHTIMGAYDTKTDSMVWQRTSEKQDGWGNDNMCIVDDKLYIMGQAQGCYNLSDGSTVWEQRQTVDELHREVGIDASMCALGITYNNGKFYFTNTGGYLSSKMTGIDESLIKNIQCIDANNGKYIWGDLPEGSGSLDTRPIVIDGQCFVVGCDNLRVYNATSGELIGVDNSVSSIGTELNAEYNGMFIYFDTDETTETSKLTAIKPYWNSETLK